MRKVITANGSYVIITSLLLQHGNELEEGFTKVQRPLSTHMRQGWRRPLRQPVYNLYFDTIICRIEHADIRISHTGQRAGCCLCKQIEDRLAVLVIPNNMANSECKVALLRCNHRVFSNTSCCIFKTKTDF